MGARSGYRNGRLIYPVSVVDHQGRETGAEGATVVAEVTGDTTFGGNLPAAKEDTVLFINKGSGVSQVTIPSEKYLMPDGEDIVLSVPVKGYAEVNFLTTEKGVFARGA